VSKDNQSIEGKICYSTVLFTINPTRTGPGSNPGLHRLSHATNFTYKHPQLPGSTKVSMKIVTTIQ